MSNDTFSRRLNQLTKDAIRASLDEIAETLAAKLGSAVEDSETGWLVEMVQDSPQAQPRWWHPKDGWVFVASDALRFARKKDAADFIANSRCHGIPTEHIWEKQP